MIVYNDFYQQGFMGSPTVPVASKLEVGAVCQFYTSQWFQAENIFSSEG